MFHLDHFLSYTSAGDIDQYLERYHQQGFTIMNRTVRHDKGRRNGFISIGPEYLEFLWVEDEDQFAEEATDHDKEDRENRSMFAIGIVAHDLEQAREEWINRDFEVAEVVYGRPRDADPESDPRWAFLAPPEEEYGVDLFCLTYLYRTSRTRTINLHDNKVFGIVGITLVSDDIESRMSTWIDVFGCKPLQENTVELGSHFVRWLTPDQFPQKYGREYNNTRRELAIIHLLSSDLDHTRQMLGDRVLRDTEEGLFVDSLPTDGFVFLITEADVEEWRVKKEEIMGLELE